MCVCFRSALHEPESHHLLIKGAKAEGPGRRRSAAASSTRGRNRAPPKGANSNAMFMGQLLRPAALSLASTGESVVKVAGWWEWVGEGAEEKMHHRTNSVWIYSFMSTIHISNVIHIDARICKTFLVILHKLIPKHKRKCK